MRNLIIDIGNTRIKSALFQDQELVQELAFTDLEEAIPVWKTLELGHCLVSSVRWSKEELEKQLGFSFLFLDRLTPIPVKNGYGTPETLGLDRIAAAVGGWAMSQGKPVLVIDMGSCLTFEFVDGNGVYLGGAISPGLAMRAKAMNQFTARLPLVSLSEKPKKLMGDSTQTCMQSGIWYGVEFEIKGQIEAYRSEFPEIKVFVCGGDAQSFDSLAKDHIFVVPNLVLHGLNCILNHNVE
ncbi:type III pantothenate kinase [Algoriphagus sp. CAU 1675]|uniref:type III pantothenate kinase n=1 Tax=Algoriphagus sp. CAU 1675 TaxID=3032597 RepID=UPI0023DC4C9B|nr:type III pantothenate kinase [Algoriphagus sp. CAU 1675]MDF2156312.1 type III pantothenate kinase [Algoriphagus sp. CAU 1675]